MIKYKNEMGEIVTQQQFNQLKNYIMETVDDVTGHIVKEENVYHSTRKIFKSISYYLDNDNEYNDKLNEFMQVPDATSVRIFFNKVSAFDFRLYDAHVYKKDGILFKKEKYVFDNQNRLIMHCDIDLQTENLIYPNSKYYYGNETELQIYGPDFYLKFSYEFDSETNQLITYVSDKSENPFHINQLNVNKAIEYFGQAFWDAHPYYHTMFPLLPESAVI
jgi:hypothetical protein